MFLERKENITPLVWNTVLWRAKILPVNTETDEKTSRCQPECAAIPSRFLLFTGHTVCWVYSNRVFAYKKRYVHNRTISTILTWYPSDRKTWPVGKLRTPIGWLPSAGKERRSRSIRGSRGGVGPPPLPPRSFKLPSFLYLYVARKLRMTFQTEASQFCP